MASFCAAWKAARAAYESTQETQPLSGQQKLGEEMGNTLWQASAAGDAAKVAALLGAQDLESFLNYQNKSTFTALHAATANNDLDVTRLLIEAGCNVNVTTDFGRTHS